MDINKVADMASETWGNNVDLKFEELSPTNSVVAQPACIVCDKISNLAKVVYYNPDEAEEDVFLRIKDAYNAPIPRNVENFVADINSLSRDIILDEVRPVLLNPRRNSKLLESAVYSEFLDLVECYKIFNESCSVTITHQMLDVFGITMDDIRENAIKNCKRSVVIRPLIDFLAEFIDIPESDFTPLFMVTNNEGRYGAAYMNIMDVISQVLNRMETQNAIILPSSIHEILVTPAYDIPMSEVRSLVSSVNTTTLNAIDYLSDSVYEAQRTENGEIHIVSHS